MRVHVYSSDEITSVELVEKSGHAGLRFNVGSKDAVTFWGTRRLRAPLKAALAKLAKLHGRKAPRKTVVKRAVKTPARKVTRTRRRAVACSAA